MGRSVWSKSRAKNIPKFSNLNVNPRYCSNTSITSFFVGPIWRYWKLIIYFNESNTTSGSNRLNGQKWHSQLWKIYCSRHRKSSITKKTQLTTTNSDTRNKSLFSTHRGNSFGQLSVVSNHFDVLCVSNRSFTPINCEFSRNKRLDKCERMIFFLFFWTKWCLWKMTDRLLSLSSW